MKKLFRFAALCAAALAVSPAGAVTSISILDGSGATKSTAWDQDGSSRYFALGGIYGKSGDYQADVFSDFGLGAHLVNSIPAGSNVIGGVTQSGTWTEGRTWTANSATDSITAVISGTPSISVTPSASGGFTHSGVFAGLTTPQAVKTSAAGQLVRIQCDNLNGTAAAFVQIYDAATAGAVTQGSGLADYVPLAVGGTGGYTLASAGVQYINGIVISAATTLAGSSTTNISVNCSPTYK